MKKKHIEDWEWKKWKYLNKVKKDDQKLEIDQLKYSLNKVRDDQRSK